MMTKKQALEQFKEFGIKSDKTALREAWNNYTDALSKNREITRKQYDTWTNPF